jgi:4-amino-4-deoxy-L-arabinose transferase-like glycosyltransferase
MGSTPPEHHARSTNSPQAAGYLSRRAAVLGLLALALFAANLFANSFVDEYAYITQSYYADRFFGGQFNHPDWLDVYAFDLQPVPKYLIGVSLRAAHLRMPAPTDAAQWYSNIHYQFGDRDTLLAARIPIALLGALGGVALFGFGVLVKDRRVGTVAAALLILNPLYALHAHRAMSEIPYEAFLVTALALGLSAMRRFSTGGHRMGSLLLVVLAGMAAGLSILCKFNGLLALIVIGCWGMLALIAPRLSTLRKAALAGAALGIAVVAMAIFIGLNPAMTARPEGRLNKWCVAKPDQGPWQRFRRMVELRLETSAGQHENFPNDALKTTTERAKVFAVQGFGRFGPFGPSESNSKVRYERRQDWGAILWWPVVLFGLFQTIRLGRSQLREGRPSTAIAALVWVVVTWSVVAGYLPMAWDRYLLPIQAPNALLAAVGASALWDRLREPFLGAWRRLYAPAAGVFVILLGSYAFFWHSRDWNTASRLMLTYAMVDRGTVSIDGLEKQTGDKAEFEGRFYSDKLPGYSFLACLPYAYAKWAFDLPSHPLNTTAEAQGAHWWPDYWITLGTSGLFTAGAAALLVILARDLGCSPRAAVLVGLAYGLSTPAYVYATLAYGHQVSAFVILAAFYLLWKPGPRREGLRIFFAGFLAAYASVIELQLAPVSVILGVYLLAQWIRGRRRFDRLFLFALGALIPSLLLLAYNQAAFHSPWDMGYFHHAYEEFARLHSRDNPLGLMRPDWGKVIPLLWGPYRGLLFYAPILFLAVPGWVALMVRRHGELATVSMLVVAAIFLVNLSYPEWTGGWSTGPRLLVPLIPFAMIPVAGLLAGSSRWSKAAKVAAIGLALVGGVEMLLFQGADGRIPHEGVDARGRTGPLAEPLAQQVWPLWTGRDPTPGWRFGEQFTRNMVSVRASSWLDRLAPRRRFVQFLPLILGQILAIVVLWRHGATRAVRATEAPDGDVELHPARP